jgi:hypothetical protein
MEFQSPDQRAVCGRKRHLARARETHLEERLCERDVLSVAELVERGRVGIGRDEESDGREGVASVEVDLFDGEGGVGWVNAELFCQVMEMWDVGKSTSEGDSLGPAPFKGNGFLGLDGVLNPPQNWERRGEKSTRELMIGKAGSA